MGPLLRHRGRLTEAFASTAAGRAAALESGEQGGRFVVVADNVRSWLLRSVGRLDEADDLSIASHELAARYGQSTNEMRCAAMLDLIDGRLFVGDVDGAAAAVERAVEIDTFRGTMAWHHRQRYGVQRARLALLERDPETARARASTVEADANARGTRRYDVLAHAHVALADAALGREVDHDALELALVPLDDCAVLEGWWLTAELAAATHEDRWWRAAERRAGALIGNAGEHAETLQQWVASRFSALGRR